MSEEILNRLIQHETPFYFYDMELLQETLDAIKAASVDHGFVVHYAIKANANRPILLKIKEAGFGADCVSGNELKRAVDCGFNPSHIAFAGVGKTDKEIRFALKHDIFSFNCESVQELEVINQLAGQMGKVAKISLRINPNVNPNTHRYITTGLEENKFGISPWELDGVVDKFETLKNVRLTGMHFHIGSQITNLSAFKKLSSRVNEFQKYFLNRQIILEHINVGGGLGVNYQDPKSGKIADFKAYFDIFAEIIELRSSQTIHFELGRAVVAQCGQLISRVLYVKEGVRTHFVILDASMTELIRPALYQAYHTIENISKVNDKKAVANTRKYDVVGPVCESSDCFGKAVSMPETKRGDLVAIYTAGAYGEVMASSYNLRDLPRAIYSIE